MNTNFSSFILGLAILSGAYATTASAQIISVPGLGTTTLSGSDGDYALSTSGNNYVSQFDAAGSTLPSLDVALTDGSGTNLETASGWVFSGRQGNTWIANVNLGDPTISYSIAFQNTTGGSETYNVILSVPIAPSATYSPNSDVRSTVSGSLLNGGSTPASMGGVMATLTPALNSTTGAPGTFLQASTLSLASGGTVSTNVDLTPGTITAGADGGNTTFSAQTLNYNLYNPNGPSGTFNALTLNLSFSLSAGDYASFTGRVDVQAIPGSGGTNDVPEPNGAELSLLGLSMLAFVFYIRRHRAP